ncbi:MAG: plasmid pRiA4b ORF-3 family protein [Acidobacteria bacterium]|nr:plasmid pRiA4b ORF-3 family protein [Acidobacteriota bacterium]
MLRRVTYELRIDLNGTKPPIWRRVLVPPSLPLDRLHDVIQVAMGWLDGHLHMFVKGRQTYALPNPWGDDWTLPGAPAMRDERKFGVSQLLKREKDWLRYEYDFGDGWEHRVTLQKILPYDSTVRLPACTGGRRNCPPEDSGGVWGYYDKLEILKDPDREEHDEIRDWMGADFDPEEFSVEYVNAVFRSMDS